MDLQQHAKTQCPSCIFKVFSYSTQSHWSYDSSLDEDDWFNVGDQNLHNISKDLDDGVIMPYKGNLWLTLDSYQFPTVTQNMFGSTGKYPGVSFYITDEWEYPAKFYRGLLKYAEQNNVPFITFHNINSFDGHFGPAFLPSHYEKIALFGEPGVVEELCGNGICWLDEDEVSCPEDCRCEANFNCDQNVDGLDMTIFFRRFWKKCLESSLYNIFGDVVN